MIAAIEPKCQVEPRCETRTFEELLPGIERQARVAFRSLPASEREESVAETVANAFVAYSRLVERGKTM